MTEKELSGTEYKGLVTPVDIRIASKLELAGRLRVDEGIIEAQRSCRNTYS